MKYSELHEHTNVDMEMDIFKMNMKYLHILKNIIKQMKDKVRLERPLGVIEI